MAVRHSTAFALFALALPAAAALPGDINTKTLDTYGSFSVGISCPALLVDSCSFGPAYAHAFLANNGVMQALPGDTVLPTTNAGGRATVLSARSVNIHGDVAGSLAGVDFFDSFPGQSTMLQHDFLGYLAVVWVNGQLKNPQRPGYFGFDSEAVYINNAGQVLIRSSSGFFVDNVYTDEITSLDGNYGRAVLGAVFSASNQHIEIANLLAVPEPETWALMVAGFLLLFVRRRAKILGLLALSIGTAHAQYSSQELTPDSVDNGQIQRTFPLFQPLPGLNGSVAPGVIGGVNHLELAVTFQQPLASQTAFMLSHNGISVTVFQSADLILPNAPVTFYFVSGANIPIPSGDHSADSPVSGGAYIPTQSFLPFFNQQVQGPWTLTILDSTPGNATQYFSSLLVADVPEPETWAMMMVGLCGWWWARRKH